VKTVSVPKGSRTVKALLDQARDEDVVVRTDDGTQFLIRAMDEFGREVERQRRNKKLMAYLDQCAQETEWIPLAEVERRLRLSPRKTSKTRRS
jgi:hypothetical protein